MWERGLITCHCHNVSQEFKEADNTVPFCFIIHFSNAMCESLCKHANICLSLKISVWNPTTAWLTMANCIPAEPPTTAIWILSHHLKTWWSTLSNLRIANNAATNNHYNSLPLWPISIYPLPKIICTTGTSALFQDQFNSLCSLRTERGNTLMPILTFCPLCFDCINNWNRNKTKKSIAWHWKRWWWKQMPYFKYMCIMCMWVSWEVLYDIIWN